MKKYQRLQGEDWHSVKNNFRLLYTYKSDNGNIKGIYTDGKIKISHWLNDEEKTEYLQKIKEGVKMKINMYKIYEYKSKLQDELTFEEISKLYREILYDEYTKAKDYDVIHCYQLVRNTIDIFTQMTKGRKFDKNYLKDNIKW